MTAPQRLIEGEDEFERDLILSARGDRPGRRALDLMLVGLGVEASKLPAALASSTASVGASSKIGGIMLAKWLVTGVVIGFAAIGGVEAIGGALEHRSPHTAQAPKPSLGPAPSPASTSEGVSPLEPREDTPSMAPAASSAVVPDVRPRVATSSAAEVSTAPTPLASERSRSSGGSSKGPAFGSFAVEGAQVPQNSLAAEMRLVDAARRAVLSGDSRGALSTLGSYERAFPNGALAPEATVLKVRALLAVGDRAGAQALGQHVIDRAPRSEHADAVRTALGLPSNP